MGGLGPPVPASRGCPLLPVAAVAAAPSPGRCRFPTRFWTGSRPTRPSSFCTGSSAAKPTSTPSPRPWPSRQVLTVDARNHGDSPHSPNMSYEAMSQDLQDLLPQLGLVPCVLVGHSMGGKTAMLLALQRPELVERLIAVDISPAETTSVSDLPTYMAAMRAIDIPAEVPRSRARKLADEQLSPVIKDMAVRQFLLTNLVEVDGRFVWRVNLDALAQHVDAIMAFPPLQDAYPGPTLFLLGGNSQYVHPSHHPEIRRLFPQAQMQTVPDAGHWIHADRPQDFVAAIRGFLLPPGGQGSSSSWTDGFFDGPTGSAGTLTDGVDGDSLLRRSLPCTRTFFPFVFNKYEERGGTLRLSTSHFHP
ncbi:protein ABHD11 isoform X2 [Choloepus didactylus]|uniref:protein ABHD11 isoform X2 n=1 Tax=Choloepus didactylus TaxID=27675 RepID=UPI00189E4B2A|nr:protein ABHD11 isoform X2 [Choloepus didactylus]